MPRNAEGMLDDLSGISAEPTPVPEPVPEPAAPEPVKVEADASPAPDKPVKDDPANSPARPDGYVPKQALEEARREAKEARERAALYEDRTNKIIERYFKENEPPPAEPEIDLGPDPDTDPVGAVKWMREQRAAELRQRQEQAAQQAQEQQGRSQLERAYNAVNSRYEAVSKDHPEVADAYNALVASYKAEYAALRYSPEQTLKALAELEAKNIAYVYQNGIPVEDFILGLAQSRGWQAKAAAPVSEAKPAVTPPRDPATGQFLPSEAEKAAKIAQSQERNGSLSQAPGAPVEKMTAKELASLSEEEMWRRFDAMKNSKGKKEFDRQMGFFLNPI